MNDDMYEVMDELIIESKGGEIEIEEVIALTSFSWF